MLFIPEGWSHGTVNMGDAVGVSLQAYHYRSAAQRLDAEISTARYTGDRAQVRVL